MGDDNKALEPGYLAVIRFLQQFERADRIVDCYSEDLLKLKEKATRAVAAAGSDFCGEPNPQKTEKLLVEIWNLETTLNESIAELIEMKQFIVAIIATIEDPTGCAVIAFRYMRYMSFADIAKRLEISIRSVRRAHDMALKQLADQLKQHSAQCNRSPNQP